MSGAPPTMIPRREAAEAYAENTGSLSLAEPRGTAFNEYYLPALLFGLTLLSSFYAGIQIASSPGESPNYSGAAQFAVALMAILGSHEMGHYLTARALGVPVSLPFFIPVPPPFLLGTMGAIIRLRGLPRDRSALLKVGAAGPLAGGVVAIGVMVYGVASSTPIGIPKEHISPILSLVTPASAAVCHAFMTYAFDGSWWAGSAFEWCATLSVRFATAQHLVLGDSLGTWALQRVIWPALGTEQTLLVSPAFMAAWAGFLITMMNLIPLGQLDGGHVGYALLGPRLNRVGMFILASVAGLSVFGWYGWIFWALVINFFGRTHFGVPDPHRPLDTLAKVLALACLVMFIVTFMPTPLLISTGRIR